MAGPAHCATGKPVRIRGRLRALVIPAPLEYPCPSPSLEAASPRSSARFASFSQSKGIDYELDPVNPFSPPEGFKELSPLGKISAFRDGDRILADSSIICAYLERKHPNPGIGISGCVLARCPGMGVMSTAGTVRAHSLQKGYRKNGSSGIRVGPMSPCFPCRMG
jgi:hypothetical protein